MGGIATFTNCLFKDNYADVAGGLNSWGPSPVIIDNCTFVNNQSPGAFPCQLYNYTGSLDIRDSIIAFGVGGESMSEMGITLSHCNVFGNEGGDWVGTIAGQFGANGNISEDPLFASGVEGGYYLSQTAAGQSVNSPCVDAGDPQSPMIQGTTRTDGVADSGVVDMGFHYSAGAVVVTGPHLVAGPGLGYDNPPNVRIIPPAQGAAAVNEFSAYGVPHYGVNVSCGDIDGDGMDEIVTGAGPGAVFGAHVRGWNYDGSALTELAGLNFFAWTPSETRYGANVFAGADLDGDGRDELVVGAGPDPAVATRVKVYRYDGAQVTQRFSLEAFPGLTHGVNVAAGRF